ncbi:6-phosphofructokinase [Flavicella sp.]|uniref:6-phosphofructokinase n=1 Tax=Flavicella sp. TaxID=2957742 RepID=UPI003019FB1A
MNIQLKKIAVMTSGGDSPGMNAAIRSVVRTCAYHKVKCVGVYQGYQGMIEGKFIDLNARSVNNIINKGGTMLQSARSMEFMTVEGRVKAYENLIAKGIEGLVIIGGDGTFTGGMIFNQEHNFPIIGIPCTIDNDIYGTQFTLGYDTCLNTAVEAIDKIRDTASSHNRLFFVEVMGRDAGFIALNAGVGAGAEEILIPEENIGLDKMLESLIKSKESGKTSSIVVVAEGEKTGKNIFELAEYVEENLPEYDVRVSVLGHMQRGGAPSCFDRVLASRFGVSAVELLLSGSSNLMVGFVNNEIKYTPLEKAVKEHHKIDEELLRVADIMSV